jgi:dTDP-4-dehydrorhamnose 3,5-epimerase
MIITRCSEIEGLIIIEPDVYRDERGYFMESFSAAKYEEVCNTRFVQENESMSRYGVLRGLHFQRSPYAQAKLVRVVKGSILDVAVDIREGSSTYGKHYTIELNGDNKKAFFIPRGFAHGFVVLSQEVIFQYKCDNYYAPKSEGSIIWNDPTIAIDWSVPADDIILSEKDRTAPLLTR